MNKQDIIEALNTLSEVRPVFHSEADFQHELAHILALKGVNCRRKPFLIVAGHP